MTDSEITVRRAPIEFLEIELATLAEMGLKFELSKEYFANNGQTRLVDIKLQRSNSRRQRINFTPCRFLESIWTICHSWGLSRRWLRGARWFRLELRKPSNLLTELSKLNAQIELVDPHRVYITGPTRWKPADVVAPPALRPSVVILLAMLVAPGVSILRDVYSINRGYEELAARLNSLGAEIEVIIE